MQVGVRSYLVGGITAAGFGALAIAPLPAIGPPDVQVSEAQSPDIENAALADVFNPAFIYDQAIILNNGLGTSITTNNSVVPPILNDPLAVTNALADAPTFIATGLNYGVPNTIGTPGTKLTNGINPLQAVYTGVPGTATPEQGVPGTKSSTWVAVDGAPGVAAGYVVSDPSNPASATKVNVPGVVPAGFRGGVDTVENNLISNGVPGATTLKAVTVQSRKVGTAVVQAQGLVRDATVNAVQGTVNAATSGGDVGGAIQTGASKVGKSVFGDASITYKVDPNSGKPVTASTPGSVDSIHKLGAIGTVSKSVQNAASEIGNSSTP